MTETPISATVLDRFANLCADERLQFGQIHVLEADSGRSLINKSADVPTQTASVLKLFTCAVALHVLGPDFRMRTRVMLDHSGKVVLVGGGDVTLSRVPWDEPTLYPQPGRLDELARKTQQSPGRPDLTTIYYDDALFSKCEWRDDSWSVDDRDPGGYMSIISALQCDGDRKNPVSIDSVRGSQPALDTATSFASYFAAQPKIRKYTGGSYVEELASVVSAPLHALVRKVLVTSDNVLAEAIARHAAIAVGEELTFPGIERMFLRVLDELRVTPLEGATFADASGLSDKTFVAPATVTDLLRRMRDRQGLLGLVDDRLTRSGPDGTLPKNRFIGNNAVVADRVRAKTGYTTRVHSLAGVVETRAGKDLIFAVFANGKNFAPDADARQAIDDLVAQLHLFGDELLVFKDELHFD